MKNIRFKFSDRITTCKHLLTATTCLLAGVFTSSASVTVQGWWRGGEAGSYQADSSTNGRNFVFSFSQVNGANFGGNPGAGIVSPGCGGPLGTTGAVSTDCMFWTPLNCDAAGMWGPGNATDPVGGYNPPSSNYVIECYVLPYGTGTYNATNGGTTCHFFNSGANDFSQPSRSPGAGPGGVYFCVSNSIDDGTNQVLIGAWVVANANEGVTNDVQIGTYVPANTNAWTYVAVVNDGGTNTFYVNGIANGSTNANTVPNGNICVATDSQGTQPTFAGYLDELRISTFDPGAFTTNDLLYRAGPSVVAQPQAAVVWDGGAAPFTVIPAYDTSTTYQWELGGSAIAGATNAEYYVNVVNTSESGNEYSCALTNSTDLGVTSSNAILTVVATNSAIIAAYRTNVTSDPGLLAYYTVDGDTGTTLTDSISTNTGTLEGTAEYDGRTNRAFGSRALRFRSTLDGDVTIPNNPQFEFGNTPSQAGSIEAVVYLDPLTTFVYLNQYAEGGNETLFSEADAYNSNNIPNPTYFEIQTSPAGNTLYYQSDASPEPVVWSLSNPLEGRAALVDIVFTNGTVTAYVDGLSLGTQANPGFGTAGGPLWIGSSGGLSAPGGRFTGDLDEIALYSDALSPDTIALHNYKFIFGTNEVGPSITTLTTTGSKTLLAGGLVSVTVDASGTAPLSFEWTLNSVPLANQTSATLSLPTTSTNESGSYSVIISNAYGAVTSATFTLTFVAPTNFYTERIMADNPMALWQLNEASGPTAFDSAGGNDGTYASTNVTLGQPGVPGLSNNAAHFNGATNSYVTVPFNPVLNPQGPFSVEFWANSDLNALTSGVDYTEGGSAQFENGTQVNGWTLYDNYYGDGYEIQLANPAGVSLWANYVPDALGQTWYNVVAVYDGAGTLSIYINGQLFGQNSMVANGGVFAANPSAPLLIGVRNDLAIPFLGYIQNFALYNYALSPAQIITHYTVPAMITQQQPGVTNVETSTVTLAPEVSGSPNIYQWFFNNQPLPAGILNSDGTDHYSGGVTNASLIITEAVPTDSGSYYLAITNPIGDLNSSNIAVVITPTVNPPTIVSVTGLATPNTAGTPGGTIPFAVKVLFSGRIDPTTGGNVANYSLGPNVTISGVTLLGTGPNDLAAESLGADWREALLVTSGLTPGQQYSLTVSGLKDQSQTPLTIPTTTTHFNAPVLTSGMVNWDYYYLGNSQGGIVSALQGDPNYQAYAPQTNAFLTAFDTDQITGGALNNNPIFGSLGDNYGDVTSGWITPTVTTNYTFFLWTDDSGELDLSPDSNPGHASPIATEPSAGSGFVETNSSGGNLPSQDSTPQLLTAGQSYYIQVLHSEGGGADYAKVAWRMEGDSTPARNLTPIPGAFLSTYATAAVVAPQLGALGLTNGILTLNWSGGTIQQSTDLLNWTNVPGNPNPLTLSVNSTTNTLFFRLIEP